MDFISVPGHLLKSFSISLSTLSIVEVVSFFFDKHTATPLNQEHLEHESTEYIAAGFAGAEAFIDAVDIAFDEVSRACR